MFMVQLYLFINSCHDGSANLHTQHKTALEVLLQKQRLHNGHGQQKHSVQIALPRITAFVLSKVDHQSK